MGSRAAVVRCLGPAAARPLPKLVLLLVLEEDRVQLQASWTRTCHSSAAQGLHLGGCCCYGQRARKPQGDLALLLLLLLPELRAGLG